ncbi:hypothetical protein V6R21_32065 [Limibacter armeniacum]|uniref:tetratricopeptide repeat protein n=1 Tax=Limibacter armeniacum TaxID=466084 RepID=UPI002FE61086
MRVNFCIITLWCMVNAVHAQAKKDPCLDFALTIDSSLYHRDPTFFTQNIDYDAFTKKVFAPFNITPVEASSLKGELQQQLNIGDIVLQSIGTDGIYEFVRILEKSSVRKSLLFRHVGEDGWLNYHEIYLSQIGDSYKIEDIYTYDAGLWLSETISSVLVMESDLPLKNRNAGENQLLIDSVFIMNQQGDFSETMKYYKRLPSVYQDKEALLISALIAAFAVKDSSKDALINRYLVKHPQSPGLTLVLADIYTQERRTHKALKQYEFLDVLIGGDIYLDYKKAELLVKEGKVKKGEKMCEDIIQRKEEMIEARLLLMDCYYIRKKYSEFLVQLETLASSMETTPSKVFAAEDYPEFFNSERWEKYSGK